MISLGPKMGLYSKSYSMALSGKGEARMWRMQRRRREEEEEKRGEGG
jgi:hypothetical protein